MSEDLSKCPHCAGTGFCLRSYGEHQAVVRRTLSAGAVEQRRMAGKARAKLGGRDPETGMYLTREEREAREQAYYEWLYEKPGRAGGVARADTAFRDRDGCLRGSWNPK